MPRDAPPRVGSSTPAFMTAPDRPVRDEGLWRFSTRVYRLERVASACLALQDRSGLDVNMLLFCCWAGTTIGTLPEPVVRAAVAFSTEWSAHVVWPLRSARRWMKTETGESPLRDAIKRNELEAERLQQETLEAQVAGLPRRAPGPDAVRANLDAWLGAVGVGLDDVGMADLETVIAASTGTAANR